MRGVKEERDAAGVISESASGSLGRLLLFNFYQKVGHFSEQASLFRGLLS